MYKKLHSANHTPATAVLLSLLQPLASYTSSQIPTVVVNKVQLLSAEGAYGLARPARSCWKPTFLNTFELTSLG